MIAILTALRGAQLGQPPAITAAYAATVRSLIAVIITLNELVKRQLVLEGARSIPQKTPSQTL